MVCGGAGYQSVGGAGLPSVEDAAGFFVQEAAVVGELDLEGQLFAGVAAGVVYGGGMRWQ